MLFNFSSSDWIGFYEEFIGFKLDFSAIEKEIDFNLLNIKTVGRKSVNRRLRLFKQIYFEEENLCTHEVYLMSSL